MGNSWKKKSKQSNIIDNKLGNEPKQLHSNKVLILGSPDVGKSTIFKAIEWNIKKNKLDEHSADYISIIRGICGQFMMQLLSEASNELEELTDDDTTIWHIKRLVGLQSHFWDITENMNVELNEIKESVSFLWNLVQIKSVFYSRMKTKMNVNDNADYFFNKINVIFDEDYKPSYDDMLRVRVLTTGIIEFMWMNDNIQYQMYDVGGRRSEREKWLHLFNDIKCVIFVCAVSQYAMHSLYSNDDNALKENIALFETFSEIPTFERTTFILVLNKIDVFKKFIVETPLTECFNEYKGNNCEDFGKSLLFHQILKSYERLLGYYIPDNINHLIGMYSSYLACDYWIDICYNDAIEFIKNKYLGLCKLKKIKVYETSALNYKDVETVLKEVYNIHANDAISHQD